MLSSSLPSAASERDARLKLALTPGVGPVAFAQLLAHFGSALEVLHHAQSGTARAVVPASTSQPSLARALRGSAGSRAADAARKWICGASDRRLILLGDADYPRLLAELDAAPPVLFVEGTPHALAAPMVAMVGARRASAYGLEVARWFSGALAQRGMTIVSGLALGIDAAAHQGALDAGGCTVAVCATGLDDVYPQRHRALARRVTGSGALVSEFALGTKARPGLFPARNRVIAGLCRATLIVEARPRSGSLVTATLAADMGREVCAIPGPVGNGGSTGCHALIREGAWLVEHPDQVLELCDQGGRVAGDTLRDTGVPGPPCTGTSVCPDSAREVLAAVAAGADSLDALVATTGLTPARLSSILTALELEGLLVSDANGTLASVYPTGTPA